MCPDTDTPASHARIASTEKKLGGKRLSVELVQAVETRQRS
jgi:hypothetical protein